MIVRNILLTSVIACVALPVFPQTNNTPAVLSVARVQVKPDRVQEWLAIEKQYSEAYKKGGGTLRFVYRNRAGNPYEFLVVTAVGKYANLDEKSPYAKGTTDAALVSMQLRRNQCVDLVRTSYETSLPDLAITGQTPAPERFRVTRVLARNGAAADLLKVMKDEYVPALKKAGVKSFTGRRVEYGGNRNQFSFRMGMTKFADLDERGLLAKGIGAEAAAKLQAKLAQLVANSEYLLYSLEKDASVQATQ